MQIDKPTLKKVAAIVGGAVLLNWLLQNITSVGGALRSLWGFIFPFILGYIIAFLLNIPLNFIERVVFRGRTFRMRRVLSYILTLVLVLAVLAFVIFLVVPQLVTTIEMLVNSMPSYLARIQETLKPYEQYVPQIEQMLNDLKLDWSSILTEILNMLKSGAFNDFFSSAWGVANSIFSVVSSFVIGLIFSAYLLLDKEHLTAQFTGLLKAYLPTKVYAGLYDVASLTSRIFSKFVSGQCLESVAVAILFTIALFVGGFDYALLIGVLIGFFSLIPIFGSFIACVIGALLILVSMGFWRCVAFLILFIVLQQLDGNFMYPRIVGNSVGLPPIWVLVAVTIGGSLMGLFGMLFFIPLASVIYALVRRNANARLREKGIPNPVEELPKRKKTSRHFIKSGKNKKK